MREATANRRITAVFREVVKPCIQTCMDEYVTRCICQNPQNFTVQREPSCVQMNNSNGGGGTTCKMWQDSLTMSQMDVHLGDLGDEVRVYRHGVCGARD